MDNVPMLYEPVEEYQQQIRTAKDLEQLKQRMVNWQWLCMDAVEVVDQMKPKDWDEWQKFLIDSKDEEASYKMPNEIMQKYNVIVMPADMFEASLVAFQFKTPWGVAYNRLKQEKFLPSQKNKKKNIT